MNRILSYIEKVPDYLRQEFSSRMLVCVIVLIVYLFVLFFSNKVADVLRKIFIVACIGFAVIGGFRGPNKNGFEMICTAVLALILLGIIRLISYIIRTVRQNRIDARIEERALAKAAKRRGSFKNKQGYSGASKPIEDDYVPDEMSKEEIRDVVDNDEVSAADEKTAASFSENEEPQKAASGLSAAENPAETDADAAEPSPAVSSSGTEVRTSAVSSSEEAPGVSSAIPSPSDTSGRPSDAAPAPQAKSTGSSVSPAHAVQSPAPKAAAPSLSRDDVYDALTKLGDLRDKGILTEEEFTAKKSELLAKIG